MSTDTPNARRVRDIVEPIAADLQLDVYDVEQRGATMRVTLDTVPGSPGGVDLDQLALATRLISRELDHQDPIPGKYTLEVTSPGVERSLRTAAHFQREIGKIVSVRLANTARDAGADSRRFQGELVAADEHRATFRVDGADRVVDLDSIDRAHTVFEWGPKPKPGGKKSAGKGTGAKGRAEKSAGAATAPANQEHTGSTSADEMMEESS